MDGSTANQKTVASLVQQAETARAAAVRREMERHKGNLNPPDYKQLARNVGRLLDRAKKAGVAMRSVALDAGISVNPIKPENALALYRLYEDGRRTAKEPRLRKRVAGYLAVALAVARHLNISDSEAILELAQDTRTFDTKIPADARLEPVEQVLALLRARLREIELRHDLDGYFREAQALDAVPFLGTKSREFSWEDPGAEVIPDWPKSGPRGWECEVGYSTGRGLWCWPSVLLTAVIRSSAPARIAVDNKSLRGRAMWIEKVFLQMGFGSDGLVRPYLTFVTCTAAEVCDPSHFFPHHPWVQPGYPPPRGEWPLGEVVVTIEAGKRISIPSIYENDESREDANLDLMITGTRVMRLDTAALSELSERKPLFIAGQLLPYRADASAVLVRPGSALTLLEAALLGRECVNGAFLDRDYVDFLAELDRNAALLVQSFRAWRAAGLKKATRDHQQLMAESENRAAELAKEAAKAVAERESNDGTERNGGKT